ncbi:hypothetical protein FACS1894127_0540 [Clostridia bacterium]|nr:hypothetical protein FACS1894127_0540 [Clostridia bacterium]
MSASITQQINYKIELLCYGVKPNSVVEQIYAKQNPYDQKRTGNIGIQVLLGNEKLPTNIPVRHRFTYASPYELVGVSDQFFIQKVGSENQLPIFVIDTPEWYMESVGLEKHAGDYLLQEGTSTLIASITDSCIYANSNRPCAFCGIGKDCNVHAYSDEREQQIFKSLDFAFANGIERYGSVNLTGGNSDNPHYRGIENYIPFIRYIRNKGDIPICLEVSPPQELEILKQCVDIGVNAFMMNIEIWDENLRNLFMPMKASIKREEYLKACKEAVKLVGKGNVSSVIIVGLENETSATEAINELVDIGVIPSIMPLRPNDATVLENFPTTQPNLVSSLTKKVARLLYNSGFNMDRLPGCIGCGACAAERDEFSHILKEEIAK